MTTSPTARDSAEDLVRLAASIIDYPTLDQVDEMLSILQRQPKDFAQGAIIDGLLEMRTELTDVAA